MSFSKKTAWAVGALLLTTLIGFLFWIYFGPKETVAGIFIDYERSLAGLEVKRVWIPGVQISYLEGGAGETLLLIHGSGDDKDSWTPVAKYLTGRYRVIAPDLPGFGESDRLEKGGYKAQDQVKHLQAFTRTLGLTAFHLGGHSLGGKISAAYA
ncbi:MAG: alpha/beta fold hydrolase, partial [Thermodesulfobacteriota bacterium]